MLLRLLEDRIRSKVEGWLEAGGRSLGLPKPRGLSTVGDLHKRELGVLKLKINNLIFLGEAAKKKMFFSRQLTSTVLGNFGVFFSNRFKHIFL